ncbi:MAG: DUF1559 domain-containing protein [Planctomycetaceae bacterium]|nr:DUF1559 domain-containing protein [Planctomycetaceae bacterium]
MSRHRGKIVVTLLAAFLSWLIPAVFAAREAAHRSQCRNSLKQIELALHNYHDTHGCFPPAVIYGPDGKPWHSWRLLIVPYLESSPFYPQYSFDEPWNGPNNQRLTEKYDGDGWIYHCPTDTDSPPDHTSYVAVIGEGTMWPPDGAASLDDVTKDQGPTLHVVEVSDSGVHWMEPVDLRLDAMSFSVSPAKGVGIRSRHPAGANAGFADGSVRFIGESTPPDVVQSLLLRNDGGPADF